MTPGPNKILKLPDSGSLVKISTIESGNTFGARFWTDGKCEAPMMPDRPWLRRYPGSEELFWTDECELVGEEAPWDETTEFADVPFAETPTLADYRNALITDIVSTPEEEGYVRTRLWWALNDPVRHGLPPRPMAPRDRDNLTKLRDLLDKTDPNDRLTAAEVSRQLGDFEVSTALLEYAFPTDYDGTIDLIRKLNAERDTCVREVV